MDPAPTLVVFDLGRVLVRISEGWGDAFDRVGLSHLRAGLDEKMRDRSVRKAVEQHLHALEHGRILPEVFCLEAGKLIGCDSAQVASTLDGFIHGAYPGAVELLDELHAAGARIACLSNTNLRHFELMEAWLAAADRVLARIDVRGASHEMKLRKPAPEIYAALEALAGARPDEILFFDDLADNVAAARTRGWRAELVESREDPIAEMRADLVAHGVLR
jgi:HAD superfamily hydrolase (TIGR01509 family)